MGRMVVTEITVHLETGPDDPMCPESSAMRCLPVRSPVRSLAHSHSLSLSLSLSPSISRTASCRSVSRLERELSRHLVARSRIRCARGAFRVRVYEFVRASSMIDDGPTRAQSGARSLACSPARSLARTHAHACVRATKYATQQQQYDGWRDRRRRVSHVSHANSRHQIGRAHV